MMTIKLYLPTIEKVLMFISFILIFLLVEVILRRLIKEKLLPKSLNVAVIGFPKTGKTTLITLLFGDIFANRILNLRAVPTSETTIDKITKDLTSISNKQPLKPTKTQDTFGYTANIIIKQKYLSSTLKLIIGDFPGEASKNIIESQENELLENTNFRRWCNEADAYIFVIDLAMYLTSEDYVACICGKIREAIQKLTLFNINSGSNFKQRPVLVLFNKADLFNYAGSYTDDVNLQRKISHYAYEKIPEIQIVNPEKFKESVENVLQDFKDLILFINSLENCCCSLFTSGFLYDERGKRINYERLMYFLLKNSNVIDNLGNNPLLGIMKIFIKDKDI